MKEKNVPVISLAGALLHTEGTVPAVRQERVLLCVDTSAGEFILQLAETAQQILENFGQKKMPLQRHLLSTCDRRFELPTFWSVARRSIQLS